MIGTVNLTLHHNLSDLMAVALDQTYIHSFSMLIWLHLVWTSLCMDMKTALWSSHFYSHFRARFSPHIFPECYFSHILKHVFCVSMSVLWIIYWFHSSNSFYGLLKSKYLNTSWPLVVLIFIYWMWWAEFFFHSSYKIASSIERAPL